MKDVIAREFFNPFFAFDIETLEIGARDFYQFQKTNLQNYAVLKIGYYSLKHTSNRLKLFLLLSWLDIQVNSSGHGGLEFLAEGMKCNTLFQFFWQSHYLWYRQKVKGEELIKSIYIP